jgi:hypothetical protein
MHLAIASECLASPDFDAELRELMRSTPGLMALSATLRYADGHIERVTINMPDPVRLTQVN